MKRLSVIGAETCDYHEMAQSLDKLTKNIRQEGFEIICPEGCMLNATRYSNQNRTPITYIIADNAAESLSNADYIVIFWDGHNRLSTKVAELAKANGKQMRIHQTKNIIVASQRSITAILTGKKDL